MAAVHQPDMAAVHQPDMAARLAWATAPRLRGTRCKRRFRLMPAASIMAHQGSLRESVTAIRYRPRLRGTRCKRRFRLMPAASITAHQASLRESVTAHQGLLRVNSLRDFKAPAMGRGFWMAWR